MTAGVRAAESAYVKSAGFVSQHAIIFAALIFVFFLVITAKGRLPAYLKIFWG